jgi:formate dehydrogenase subunit gamma
MSENNDVVRFNLRERIEHVIVILLFVALAGTGMPQKFHESGVSKAIVNAMGGISQVRYLHRFAGVVFAIFTLSHLTGIVLGVVTKRSSLAMVPRPKDFRDAVFTIRYYLGITDQRPEYDHFDYKEKFEYWGIVFGSIIMVCTGFVLLLPMLATQVLPGQVIPAAKVAHGNEGLMALLVVIVWHLYNVHLAPDVFPMSHTIFTGKISRKRLRHEHGLEYARKFGNDEGAHESKETDGHGSKKT